LETNPAYNPPSTATPEGSLARTVLYVIWVAAFICMGIALSQFHLISASFSPMIFLTYVAMAAVSEARPSRLISGRIALTHAVGILAFVSSRETAFASAFAALTLGYTLGTVIYELQRPQVADRRTFTLRVAEEVMSASSAFMLAGIVFIALGGVIPTGAIQAKDSTSGMLIVAYAALYSGFIGVLFAVRRMARGQTVDRADRLRMLAMIILPAMLSVLGGEVARATGSFGQILLYIGTVFVLFLLYDLSNAETRLRKDLTLEQAMSNENQRLYEAQSGQVEQLALLNRVVGSLGGTLVTDTLVEHLISSASILSNATGFAIYVQWPDRLELTRCVGLGDDFSLKAPPPINIPDARTAYAAHPVVVDNLSTDARAAALRTAKLETLFRGVVEFPMVAGGELIGILSLFYAANALPTVNQIDMLRTFATQAAQALANARQYLDAIEAYQRRGERLLTLTWLSRTLSSSVDIQSMCEQVIDVVLLATGAEIGVVLLLEEYTNLSTLTIGAQRGLVKGIAEISDILGDFAPFLSPDRGTMIVYRENAVENGPPFLSQHSQTLLISPMVQGGLLFGAIWLETSSSTAFNADDVRFIEQVSHQSLIVLENARLFQRIESDRDRLATLLDTMEEGLMMVDRQGRIVIANPQIAMLGINPDLLISTGYFDLLLDTELDLATRTGFNSVQQAEQFIADLTAVGVELPPLDYNIQTSSGIRYIERRIVPIQNDDKEALGAMLVFYDRTAQHDLERSREELTHMIVHDLRSPLTAVTTSLKLIHASVPQDSKYWPVIESTTEVSRRAIRKILNRVNSMLDIAKMRSGKIALTCEYANLGQLIKMVINELEPIAIDMHVRLEFEPMGDIPTLNIDTDKTERLMMNLIDNALKYSPDEGKIIVRAYSEGESGAHQGFVRIDVIDEGPGIPSEYKLKLFESFVQVEGSKPRRGGVGLGLTFCKLVVDAHGGQLWIEDNPGGGSIFALTLPVTPLADLDIDLYDESAE